MKICIKCGVEKNEGDYHSDKTYASGKKSKCKKCCIESATEWANKNQIRKSEISDKYRRSEKYKSKNKGIYQRKIDQYRAHDIIRWGVATGKISRGPCVMCGEMKTHGHHRDYSKPLDVVWLCAKHHRGVHSNKFDIANIAIDGN